MTRGLDLLQDETAVRHGQGHRVLGTAVQTGINVFEAEEAGTVVVIPAEAAPIRRHIRRGLPGRGALAVAGVDEPGRRLGGGLRENGLLGTGGERRQRPQADEDAPCPALRFRITHHPPLRVR